MTNQSLSSGLLCHLTIMLLDKVNSAYGTRSISRAPDQFQGALILPDTHRGIFKLVVMNLSIQTASVQITGNSPSCDTKIIRCYTSNYAKFNSLNIFWLVLFASSFFVRRNIIADWK
jgi:hypothetical protein